MPDGNRIKHHADLVDRMAGTLGVDLEEAVLRGRTDMDEVTDAVLACTGCSCPEACDVWLSEHREGADNPPGYCRNADLFSLLQGRQTS
ncbi:DUF6455 family protein [Thalassococcus sp. S3]|uniref:DUF6455 family protein n=1 Tax=Thalassococcus sp. S3 TaxID=2017482 RepID=UPI0010242DC0|nr:DUF6455 family protein [Thalassococcus sp. S3]QBF30958.1 hypothetical protein CFI11_06965 [Thalassococcus sp. S3]